MVCLFHLTLLLALEWRWMKGSIFWSDVCRLFVPGTCGWHREREKTVSVKWLRPDLFRMNNKESKGHFPYLSSSSGTPGVRIPSYSLLLPRCWPHWVWGHELHRLQTLGPRIPKIPIIHVRLGLGWDLYRYLGLLGLFDMSWAERRSKVIKKCPLLWAHNFVIEKSHG